ncbi:class I SAM-dependent methyltransferase [Salinarimonas soli]|uniref:Class I SAM-dependent methyltransferase n=1 Tax=Salinarimonas soli TaxID=1638099 RepID=A0A5B2VZI6_9HYPH|nr:class I SAM-dependent methyltransferase [Salinarimonas soli]KAA2244224.1 class I SAM-dependent methyltransferase [Salinarimonas soli]
MTGSGFKDHFSQASSLYAARRPTYPAALVDYLADLAPRTALALDAGCGTGQLSGLLARRFDRVIATDASAAQIASAVPHERVEYRVTPAQASGLDSGSVDLITVAQAAHWFDLEPFYAEVRRVARPGAVLALVTYGILTIDETVDPVFAEFYWTVVGPYWPPERRHVEEGYRSLPFPFAELEAPPLSIELAWTLDALVGYLDTWSAVRAAEKALGASPVPAAREALARVWGDPARERPVRFPLSLRAGRV